MHGKSSAPSIVFVLLPTGTAHVRQVHRPSELRQWSRAAGLAVVDIAASTTIRSLSQGTADDGRQRQLLVHLRRDRPTRGRHDPRPRHPFDIDARCRHGAGHDPARFTCCGRKKASNHWRSPRCARPGPTGAVRYDTVGFPSAQGDEFERLRQRFLTSTREPGGRHPGCSRVSEQVLLAFGGRGSALGHRDEQAGLATPDPLLERSTWRQARLLRVSGDTVNERKPHPLPLLHALAVNRVSPDHCRLRRRFPNRDIVAGPRTQASTDV